MWNFWITANEKLAAATRCGKGKSMEQNVQLLQKQMIDYVWEHGLDALLKLIQQEFERYAEYMQVGAREMEKIRRQRE